MPYTEHGWATPDLTDLIREQHERIDAEAAAYRASHPTTRKRNYNRYYLGLDLGQKADYSALAVVHRRVPPDWSPGKSPSDRPEGCVYELLGLKRYPLGTPYPAIVTHVAELMQRHPLVGVPEERPSWPDRTWPAVLVVDATGVGPPVVDLFTGARLRPVSVTITGGHTVSEPEPDEWHVPKRDLVSVLQVLLQSGRLRIAAGLPETATLCRELQNFRVRISAEGHDTCAAWRENDHDDTVLAVALACWAGEQIYPRFIHVW